MTIQVIFSEPVEVQVISQVIFMTYDFSHDYSHQSLFFAEH